jgi:hypothetical protein
MTSEQVIQRIINLNEGLERFWSQSDGWASIESAELLTKSRLDWQSSLSRHLKVYLNPDLQQDHGTLILAWTTLGALVEGTMKLFLSVWFEDYKSEDGKVDNKIIKNNKGELLGPDELALEKLKQFFALRIWPESIRKIWADLGSEDWIEWITLIQQRRNAIHAFKDRKIGTFAEFFINVEKYLGFLRKLSNTFPYPDDEDYNPREI